LIDFGKCGELTNVCGQLHFLITPKVTIADELDTGAGAQVIVRPDGVSSGLNHRYRGVGFFDFEL